MANPGCFISLYLYSLFLCLFHFLQFCSLSFIRYHALSKSGQAVLNRGLLDLHFKKYFFLSEYCMDVFAFQNKIHPAKQQCSLFSMCLDLKYDFFFLFHSINLIASVHCAAYDTKSIFSLVFKASRNHRSQFHLLWKLWAQTGAHIFSEKWFCKF